MTCMTSVVMVSAVVHTLGYLLPVCVFFVHSSSVTSGLMWRRNTSVPTKCTALIPLGRPMVVGVLAHPYFTNRHQMLPMILSLRKYCETSRQCQPSQQPARVELAKLQQRAKDWQEAEESSLARTPTEDGLHSLPPPSDALTKIHLGPRWGKAKTRFVCVSLPPAASREEGARQAIWPTPGHQESPDPLHERCPAPDPCNHAQDATAPRHRWRGNSVG